MNSRSTIGVLIDATDTDFQRGILSGIRFAAEKHDVNLLVIEGGIFRTDFRHDDYRTFIYQIAKTRRVDGLIIFTSSICLFMSDTETDDFNRKFNHVPLVNIATQSSFVPSVLVDNTPGMTDLMDHLITDHGYRRFLYIKGPEGNFDAENRYRVYRKVLDGYGIHPVHSRMIYGNFQYGTTIDNLDAYIKQHGMNFDVVVAASDEMATAVFKLLRKYGIRIPDDIAICGFDNYKNSSYMNPPLTTVSQPFLQMGITAVDILLRQLRGDAVPAETYLPSTFIRRESCGCPAPQLAMSADLMSGSGIDEADRLAGTLTAAVEDELNDILYMILSRENREEVSDAVRRLTRLYVEGVMSRDSSVFLPFWREIIDESFMFYQDYHILNDILFTLGTNTLKLVKDPAYVFSAQQLWLAGLEEVSIKSIRTEREKNLKLEIENRVLDDIRNSLLDMKSADDLAEKLSGTISHLTVSDCFITLFHAEDELLPEESELTFAYKDNVVLAMTDKKLIFPTRDILPDRFFRSRERKEYHLDLLMTPQRRLGYLIFNFNLDDRNILQSFREVVSNSLFSRQLMVQVDSQKEDLKQNLETMRRTMSGFIQTLQQTVETRDPYTAGHQRRVSDLARRIAQRMGLPDDTVESIRIGAIIHDLGKIYIPAEILNKPGQLRDIEVSLLRSHPEIAYDIIKPIDFPWPIAEIILQHHEHLDGTGYPRELKGDAIRIEARIISVADVVEAMASHRPYRAALGIEKALQEIRHYRGRWYDADAVDACIGLFTSGEFEFGDSPEETPYILSNHEHHTLKYRKQTGEK